jgi:sugar/nucleoside kinase (ribokinase family)
VDNVIADVALIVGDLCLDVYLTTSDRGNVLAPLIKGINANLISQISVRPGGTAWLFAQALRLASPVLPVPLCAIGDDWPGRFLLASATDDGTVCDGVTVVDGGSTDVVVTTNFANAERLMMRPDTKTSDRLDLGRCLSDIDLASYIIRFAWISGYTLEAQGSTRESTLKSFCAAVRAAGGVIVLDLVPHDFAKRVGEVTDVEGRIGRADIVVAELDTLVSLGFVSSPEQRFTSTEDKMIAVGKVAASDRFAAIVQHRISDASYCQVISSRAESTITTIPVPSGGPRGLGDKLAVDALVHLGLASSIP